MKIKIYPFFLIFVFLIIFFVFYKGLKNSNIYTPNVKAQIDIPEFQAINFLQRNRTKAGGLLLTPTSWAKNNYTIFETIKLITIKTAVIYFNDPYSFGTDEKDSIIKGSNIKSFTGDPVSSSTSGIKHLLK